MLHNLVVWHDSDFHQRERGGIYSSYFKLHVLRLRSFTPVTYFCKLLGIHSLVAFLQLELFRV
ncbi:hypothetical protein C6P05_05745 [Escherichia coli]|nr:hypothetical protein [Escherichia coli]EFO1161096.1 hypothetical protein [Escherichia coli]EFO2001570.1 hypothetical protein [Escherichia coli]OWG46502.1 hypothetical protein CCE11_17965 [Escherichia coli]PRP41271.1 hypothetical protein C6P05_05745 [Escherichia coli]